MAQPMPSSDGRRNGFKGDHCTWSPHTGGARATAVATLDDHEAAPAHDAPDGSAEAAAPLDSTSDLVLPPEDGGVLEKLRAENAQLRATIRELEQLLEGSSGDSPDAAQRIKEFEAVLEEKSEVIRELHRKLQEHADRPAAAAGATPREEELLALSEELERERRQLKDDEESLMAQMREMEVQMSRERAEMARQRNDLQRLQNEIRHELELAERDATLRERLAPLQRRHQEMISRRTGGEKSGVIATPAEIKPAAPKKDGSSSSIFRRLFG